MHPTSHMIINANDALCVWFAMLNVCVTPGCYRNHGSSLHTGGLTTRATAQVPTIPKLLVPMEETLILMLQRSCGCGHAHLFLRILVGPTATLAYKMRHQLNHCGALLVLPNNRLGLLCQVLCMRKPRPYTCMTTYPSPISLTLHRLLQ
jgi:hypothetical protein